MKAASVNRCVHVDAMKVAPVILQVHPVVSRLCAPIEGTDPAHLADCLGLDPAKFRQQVVASSSDAREEAQLAAASVFDDDDRYKVSSACHDCSGLASM